MSGKHGAPDHSDVVTIHALHRLDDMAELAVRLGSPVVYDRRGEVLYADDFSAGLKGWTSGAVGTGAAVALDADTYLTAGISAKLTAGSDGGANASLSRFFPLGLYVPHGVEAAFTLKTNVESLELLFTLYDGTNLIQYQARFLMATRKLQIYTDAAAWVDVSAFVSINAAIDLFHRMKLVVNLQAEKYERLLFDDKSYDLSAHAPLKSGNPTAGYFAVRILLDGDSGVNGASYIDSYVLTQNEPL